MNDKVYTGIEVLNKLYNGELTVGTKIKMVVGCNGTTDKSKLTVMWTYDYDDNNHLTLHDIEDYKNQAVIDTFTNRTARFVILKGN